MEIKYSTTILGMPFYNFYTDVTVTVYGIKGDPKTVSTFYLPPAIQASRK